MGRDELAVGEARGYVTAPDTSKLAVGEARGWTENGNEGRRGLRHWAATLKQRARPAAGKPKIGHRGKGTDG